ncbi:DUF1761 domain-containing protein [soil metagenome]
MAVIVAALVPMIVGSIWYGPLFGKRWMKLAGVKEMGMGKDGMTKFYALMLITSLVISYVLARFVIGMGALDMVSGALVGFWAWLGFVVAIKLSEYLADGRPMDLYYLDIAYRLVTLVVMGAILGIWR